VSAGGDVVAGGYIVVNGPASPGAACPGPQYIGVGPSGPLLCESGVWSAGGGGPVDGQMQAINTGYGGCWTLPGYGTWAVWIGSISYWPPSGTSGEGQPYAAGVYPGGSEWCGQNNGATQDQLIGFAWRLS
jgi:hypothetical protein